jgi:uncharacterized cupredoxin-like copper-binding protein
MSRSLLLTLLLGGLPALALADGSGHGMQAMASATEAPHGEGAGAPGDPAQVQRTVLVEMDDAMRFHPDRVQVKAGETVRFFVVNKGQVAHEMVLGDAAELKEHAAMMRSMPGMHHAGPNQVHLEPGQRGAIVWRFTQPGELQFACLVPGHMEAGMVGKVTVQP